MNLGFFPFPLSASPRRLFFLAALLLLSAVHPIRAAVRMAEIFSDGMVLQRNAHVPVWGTAEPNERVSVKFLDQTKSAVADKGGKWALNLSPMKAGGPFKMTVTGRGKPILIKDVLVGEVWLGSGQSNMMWTVAWSKDPEVEIANADHPRIRIAHKPCVRTTPDDCAFNRNRWVTVSPETVENLSATAYYFARELQKELKVPVGVIVRAVGGTPALHWIGTPAQKLRSGRDILAAWKTTSAPGVWGKHFDVVLQPLLPYKVRGVIWDQGEAGSGIPGVQPDPMRKFLINSWRHLWKEKDLPFIFVQYPKGTGWDKRKKLAPLPRTYVPSFKGLHDYDYFSQSLSLPKTFMVVSFDLEGGVHPLDKQGYAARFARAAFAGVYGKNMVIYGPKYRKMEAGNGEIRIHFDHTGGGLTALGARELRGFLVAGDAGEFVWAQARIEGDTVVAWSDKVSSPTRVRYAWSDRPYWCNLFNKDGYPALPFRSDK